MNEFTEACIYDAGRRRECHNGNCRSKRARDSGYSFKSI
jgi:hypothetical protein